MAAEDGSGEAPCLPLGIDLSAVEDAIAAVLAKQPAAGNSRRLIWESVETLARAKLQNPTDLTHGPRVASAVRSY